jgi:hypothetical protein
MDEVDAVESKIFSTPWEDLQPYLPGLRPAQHKVLSTLDGAPQYRLAITVDETLKQISGQEEVLFTNNETIPLDQVVFRIYPELFGTTVEMTNLRVDGNPADVGKSEHPSILIIPLKTILEPGSSVVVSMSFEYTMPEDGSSNYNIFASDQGLLTLAHFYPMLAVYDAKGWHTEIPSMQGDVTYTDAALYLVRVTAPVKGKVVTSGIQTAVKKSGRTQEVDFAAGPARDFFLSVGNDLTEQVTWWDDVKITSYAPEKLQTGNKTISSIVFPYPYTEFKIIATNTSAAGVEYPGLTTITQGFYDPEAEYGGLPSEVMLESVITHEAAHQWYYNLVGNDQVNNPWLDESLAQYITYRTFDRRYGKQGGDGYLASFYQRWDRVDRKEIPIGLPVSAYSETEYSAIVYGRGAIFFAELEKQLGQDEIDRFLQQYTKENQWQNATTGDLQLELETTCDCDLDSMFAEWILPIQ